MRRDGRCCSLWWSTPARLDGSGFDDGGDAGVLGGDGVVDGLQHEAGSTLVSTE
jgi:hypothetical protein